MKDYKKGRITVENRTFEIEFWTEEHFGLPYVRVCEVKTKTVKKYGLFGKSIEREYFDPIDYGWTSNRLKWAINRIGEYLQHEKDVLEEAQQIADFCNEDKKQVEV